LIGIGIIKNDKENNFTAGHTITELHEYRILNIYANDPAQFTLSEFEPEHLAYKHTRHKKNGVFAFSMQP